MYGSTESKTEAEDDKKFKVGDKSLLVLVSCGIIGVGMLLPMNFYYNADAYWKYKWRVIGNSTQNFDLGFYCKS